MKRTRLLPLLLLPALALPAPASGQEPPPSAAAGGALSALAGRLTGVRAGTPRKGGSRATRFAPSAAPLLLDDLVRTLGQTDAERKALRDLFSAGRTAYEDAAKKEGYPNDVAAAYAFFVVTHWSAATGKAVPDAASDALLAQIQTLFEGPEMRAASDADRQKLYEYCVYMSVFTAAMREAGDADTKRRMRAVAAATLKTLLPVDPAQVRLTEKGIVVAGGGGGTATPPVAANLSHRLPGGWQEKREAGAIELTRTLGTDEGALNATVLILPAKARRGAPETLCQRFFEEMIRPRLAADSPIKPDVAPETYRRYVGNGLRCAFTAVQYSRRTDSLDYFGTTQELHVYAVESGGVVVPVLVALSGQSGMAKTDGKFVSGSARDAWLEEFLAGLKGTATGKPLFTVAELAGDYKMTSGAVGPAMYSTLTGAYAGMNMVSRGNEIRLRADGTYTAKFAGASSGPSVAATAYSLNEKGKFRLEKDGAGAFLVLLAGVPVPHRDRLAGAFRLPDGRRVLVTLPVGMPVTWGHIGNSVDRYLTPPPGK